MAIVDKNFMQYSGMGGLLETNAGDQGTVFSFLCGHGQLGAFVVGVFERGKGVFGVPRWIVRSFDESGDGDIAGSDYFVGGQAHRHPADSSRGFQFYGTDFDNDLLFVISRDDADSVSFLRNGFCGDVAFTGWFLFFLRGAVPIKCGSCIVLSNGSSVGHDGLYCAEFAALWLDRIF